MPLSPAPPYVSTPGVKIMPPMPDSAKTALEPSTRVQTSVEITACSICHESLSTSQPGGSTEMPFALPCSHVFGSVCILRWLQDSAQKNCPQCRRRLIHPECGHLIMPHEANSAPPSISEDETPPFCVLCRSEDAVVVALRLEKTRLMAQERALRGMSDFLPSFFGGGTAKSSGDVEERIRDLRKAFLGFQERVWTDFVGSGRRQRW